MGSGACKASSKLPAWRAISLPPGSSSPFSTAARVTTATSTASSNPQECGQNLRLAPLASASTETCSTPSVLAEPKLLQQILLIGALCLPGLIGGGLVWVLRAERRRARLEPRLRALAVTARSPEGPVPSLRRPAPQRKALPAALTSRLDRLFAATGNRIGMLHLAATGIIGAAAIATSAVAAGLQTAPAVALGGVAAMVAPAFLVRLLQSRYQRQFL